MARDKRKTKDEVKQSKVVERNEPQNTVESRKIETHMITLPTAVKKAADIPDKKSTDPKYSGPSEGPFGFGPLVFPCLQRFNNVKFFLIMCCLVTLPHGMIFALVDLSLKVYVSQLSPSVSEAFLMDVTDYGSSFLVSILVAHFGGRGNRARWMAAASIVTGIAAIVFGAPYFYYEIIRLGAVVEEHLCIYGRKPKVCGASVIPHKLICVYLFILGQFLHGIAGIPLHVLAITFIFDHVPTFSAGLYLAIADASLTFGYIMGFLLGLKNFQMPVKEAMKAVGHVQKFRILQNGWWKTYIFIAIGSLCTTLPLLCFPSNLPGAHKIRLAKNQEHPCIDKRLINKEIKPNLKSVLHAIWCLLRNPVMLTQIFCKITESLTFKASSHFLPLYLQTHFLLTPVHSAMLTGLFIFPGCIVGRFCGGYIVDKLKMNIKNKLKFITAVSAISILLFLFLITVNCETARFPGINDDYDGFGEIGNLRAPCNENCGCTSTSYTAICGRNEKQYFSPCFAGCSASKRLKTEKAYYNCSCIKEGLTSPDEEGQYIDAFSGTCNTKCLTLPLFFAFYFSAAIYSNLSCIPALLIIMETVPTSWTSISLGVTFTLLKFIGFVPSPLFFQTVSSLCCTFWDINECGRKVRCWIYHKEKLVYTFMGTWISTQIATGIFCLYAICRHDYMVEENAKTLATSVRLAKPVKDKKAKNKEKKMINF
ncbi:solute carrier organic anion transporter family member 6C1-like [Apodemus sylvaticus]|uniref:solute carrier organic anion transporter family member 6C1-like n=1 Tax=Apodemus sylvaticus TaxID=10129 RepID=UPI002243CE79|nr:solute carrier organic anion transporter family member 6C1-like [Apodemus sylvaticus]